MIHTLFFLIVVAVTTTLGGSIVILVGMFRKYSLFLLKYIIKPWARLQLFITGTRVVVKGLEHIDPKQPYIIVSNHQSHMDIPVLIAVLPLRFTIIAKKELFRIPIFAQAMRGFGILEIDRSNRARAISTLKRAGEIARTKNVSILAFPEGTRSDDGNLKPFKKGPFMLALDTGLPILPITIDGTFPILPKNSMIISRGHTVKVTVHPPIDTHLYTHQTRDLLIAETHQRIASGMMAYES
jgi:1-acyl-sn-glycerol-3-phosphate acyltransferase